MLTLLPKPASAQFESLLDKVTDVNLFFSCWDTPANLRSSHSCVGDQSGYGIEVLWALSRLDSISTSPFFYELGLGYSQFGGFDSEDTSYELRGTVRDLPAVSLYATWMGGLPGNLNDYVKPYAGVRTGLISLQNVQAYDTFDPPNDSIGAVYNGTAQAFQAGLVGGLALGYGRMHLTGEAAYLLRDFPSVQWASAGTNRVPERIPRGLDFTGWSFAVGVQLRLRNPPK